MDMKIIAAVVVVAVVAVVAVLMMGPKGAIVAPTGGQPVTEKTCQDTVSTTGAPDHVHTWCDGDEFTGETNGHKHKINLADNLAEAAGLGGHTHQLRQLVGGDRDAHGCIGSAGYSWCEAKQKCLRIWEENCTEGYTIAEVTNETCSQDSDCETPMDYLVRSSCPFTSKCLEGRCTVVCPEPFILVGNDSDEHGCKASAGYQWCDSLQKCVRDWEEPCGPNECIGMDVSEARDIAGNAPCNGSISIDRWCNNFTNTYWFDMTIAKAGCNPVCVINTETKQAEINWMCTGLIMP